MMPTSPSKDAEVGEHDQSPDEQEQSELMERDQQDASQQQPVFDFEVKEQDRWLPIANGEFTYIYPTASATATATAIPSILPAPPHPSTLPPQRVLQLSTIAFPRKELLALDATFFLFFYIPVS